MVGAEICADQLRAVRQRLNLDVCTYGWLHVIRSHPCYGITQSTRIDRNRHEGVVGQSQQDRPTVAVAERTESLPKRFRSPACRSLYLDVGHLGAALAQLINQFTCL